MEPRTLEDLFDLLRDERNREAYEGDAEEMIKDGDEERAEELGALAGPLELVSTISAEITDCGVGASLDGESEAEDLDDIVTSCTRAALLLLHAAFEAKARAKKLRS